MKGPPGAAIICLEGASAAGKTTLSHAIAARTGAPVIAEVWALFERPSPEPPLWYLERQVERWRFAVESAGKHGLSILDGDPFQPLWYGWAYGFIEPHTLTTVTSFYHDAIAAGSLAFPDRYILLTVAGPELRRRKQADTSRSRRNFGKHVSLLRHQPRYFAAMNTICPGLAYVLDAGAPVTALAEIAISILRNEERAEDPLTLLEHLADWLRTTPSERQELGQLDPATVDIVSLANDVADGGRSEEHRGHCDVRLEEAALVRRESLRQDFRLTAAQAGFTREILKADGLQAAADRLGISLTTARTHLAHLFDRTDTRRQAEFVRLILQSQPATHAD